MRHATAVPAIGSMDLDFNEKKGIACVGAVYYLQNVNMRFRSTDDRKHVLQITKYIREPDVSVNKLNLCFLFLGCVLVKISVTMYPYSDDDSHDTSSSSKQCVCFFDEFTSRCEVFQ